ncbi:hypothetical protein D3C77_560260 [compost metagenome]
MGLNPSPLFSVYFYIKLNCVITRVLYTFINYPVLYSSRYQELYGILYQYVKVLRPLILCGKAKLLNLFELFKSNRSIPVLLSKTGIHSIYLHRLHMFTCKVFQYALFC